MQKKRWNDWSYSELKQQNSTEEVQKRHDWVGKVIHWKLGKRFKFDHNIKRYIYKQESVLENETHKILGDFEKQITSSSPEDQKMKRRKKRTYGRVDFAILLNFCENKGKQKDW